MRRNRKKAAVISAATDCVPERKTRRHHCTTVREHAAAVEVVKNVIQESAMTDSFCPKSPSGEPSHASCTWCRRNAFSARIAAKAATVGRAARGFLSPAAACDSVDCLVRVDRTLVGAVFVDRVGPIRRSVIARN